MLDVIRLGNIIKDALNGEISAQHKDKHNAFRLFHGRGKKYPEYSHLNVDYYAGFVQVISYQALTDAEVDQLKQLFSEFDGLSIVGGVIQVRAGKQVDHFPFGEALPESLTAYEHGLAYRIKLGNNQNSGLFLDMAPLRDWLIQNAGGLRVLNLFSYTGALSVAALQGGAEYVANVDMSKGVLRTATENHRLNQLPMDKVRFLGHDIFRSWGKIKKFGPYDLIIVDPPSYQKGSFDVYRDYRKLLRKMPELCTLDGGVLACLNSPKLSRAFIAELAQEEMSEFMHTGNFLSANHPWESDPEAGLKIMYYQR